MDSEPEWLLLEDVGYWLAAAAKVEKCCQLKNHPPAGDFFVGSIFISKGEKKKKKHYEFVKVKNFLKL